LEIKRDVVCVRRSWPQGAAASSGRKPSGLGCVFKLAWPAVKNQNGSPQGAAAEGGLLAHVCRWNAAPIHFELHPLGWGESRCRAALATKVRASAQSFAPAWPHTGCALSDGLCQFEDTPSGCNKCRAALSSRAKASWALAPRLGAGLTATAPPPCPALLQPIATHVLFPKHILRRFPKIPQEPLKIRRVFQ
jgi:hypothetical protein